MANGWVQAFFKVGGLGQGLFIDGCRNENLYYQPPAGRGRKLPPGIN